MQNPSRVFLSTMTLGKQEKRNLTQTKGVEKLHFLKRRETNLEQLKKISLCYGKTGYNYETLIHLLFCY